MVKVSVILPVYNTEKYIEQCLNSLLNQTLKDIEIICVDDGSNDASVRIINDFCRKDSRVSLITQKNSYAGVARNNGLQYANGKYVIFLDADDFFEPEMLLSMYEKAEKDDAQICLCAGRTFHEHTGEYQYVKYYLNTDFLPEETPFSAIDIKQRIFNAITPAPWTKLFRRDYIIENGFQFQPLKKSNDLFFVYLALAFAEKITYVDKAFVNYRIGNSNSLQGTAADYQADFYNALFSLKKELQKNKIYTVFEQSFANRALSSCLYALNRIGNKDNYTDIVNRLRDSYLYQLGVLGHTRGYFYNKADFSSMIELLKKDADMLWEEKISAEKKTQTSKTDINQWQCPVEIVNDGSIKVSVIIPVYNVEKYLDKCIESVIKNSLKDIEIICVDDGSTDRSSEILKKYEKKDSRIILISKENGGLSSARNAGMAAATGEYILFLDSDDYIEPRALEYLYAEAKNDNLDQLYFSAKSFYDDENSDRNINLQYNRKADYSGIMTGRKMFTIMSNNAEFTPSACLQFNKRVLLEENNICFIPGIIYEDNPFTLQCLYFSIRVRFENIELYNRRIRENSIMTSSKKIKRSYSYYLVMKHIEKIAQESNFKSDSEFYEALLLQLERTCFLSSNSAEEAGNEELKNFIFSLDEKEGMNYYFYINVAMKHRALIRELRKTIKQERENALINQCKNKCIESEAKRKRTEAERIRTEEKKRKLLAEEENRKKREKTLKGKMAKIIKSILK